MMAEDMKTVVDLWKKRALYMIKKGVDRQTCLFQLFEKLILFKTVTKYNQPLEDLDYILADFAEYMANEDLKYLAMKYTELTNTAASHVAQIRHRIHDSDTTGMIARTFGAPRPPF